MKLVYRSVESSDMTQILQLYSTNLPYGKMTEEKYDFWYKESKASEYNARVLVADDEIVAHNAFVKGNYFIGDEPVSIRLSSGGMVKQAYTGAFYKLMKEGLKEFSDSIIIAFPNKNSESFFTKIFRFSSIKNNYFSIGKAQYKKPADLVLPTQIMGRSKFFIKKRLEEHPYNDYQRLEYKGNVLFYKPFKGTEADIIHIEKFDYTFPKLVEDLFDLGFKKLNMVHWDDHFVAQFGFSKVENNLFVYKNSDEKFECQMIDSDIF